MNRVLTSMEKELGEEQNMNPITKGVANKSTGVVTSGREGTRNALNLPLVIDNGENNQESDRMDVCETYDSPMSWLDYQEESNQDLESMEDAELDGYQMRPVVSTEENIKEFERMTGSGLTDNFKSPLNTQDENHLELEIIPAGKFTGYLLQTRLMRVDNLQNSELVNYINYLMSTVNSPENKQQELEAMDVSELTEGNFQDKVDSSKVSDVKSSKVSYANNQAMNQMDVLGKTILVAEDSFESAINVNLNAFQDGDVDIINIYEDGCAQNFDDESPNIE